MRIEMVRALHTTFRPQAHSSKRQKTKGGRYDISTIGANLWIELTAHLRSFKITPQVSGDVLNSQISAPIIQLSCLRLRSHSYYLFDVRHSGLFQLLLDDIFIVKWPTFERPTVFTNPNGPQISSSHLYCQRIPPWILLAPTESAIDLMRSNLLSSISCRLI